MSAVAEERIQRFYPAVDRGAAFMARSGDGEYVRYSDHAAALLAARDEVASLRAALTRIRDEDSQSNHLGSEPLCGCAYCLAYAALAATQEEKC